MPETKPAGPSIPKRRRASCWWEPTYDPSLEGNLVEGGWQFDNEKGPTGKIFLAETLKRDAAGKAFVKVEDVTFTNCDFHGYFTENPRIAFHNCTFSNCDFGMSTWENTKFSGCKFSIVSFGMTTFKNCDFRSSKWKSVGLSPNELEISDTYFSNAWEFICAARTNEDKEVLAEKGVTPMFQILRLENTKATISRRVLKMLQDEGDEQAFYNAVKTFQLQHARSQAASGVLDSINSSKNPISRLLGLARCLFWMVEFSILWLFGALNGWGLSILRPLLVLVGLWFVMGLTYSNIAESSASAFARSYDITSLIGYSNYGSVENEFLYNFQILHSGLAIIIYSIVFATILNRISRVR